MTSTQSKASSVKADTVWSGIDLTFGSTTPGSASVSTCRYTLIHVAIPAGRRGESTPPPYLNVSGCQSTASAAATPATTNLTHRGRRGCVRGGGCAPLCARLGVGAGAGGLRALLLLLQPPTPSQPPNHYHLRPGNLTPQDHIIKPKHCSQWRLLILCHRAACVCSSLSIWVRVRRAQGFHGHALGVFWNLCWSSQSTRRA